MANANIKKEFAVMANRLHLGDLSRMKTNTAERKNAISFCADGYVDAKEAGDEARKNECMSGLMLLFWGEAAKMADKCKAVPGWEFDDFVIRLYECLDIACDYKAWRNNEKLTPEQCIRSVIASRGAAAILYDSNLIKNQTNVGLASLDAPLGDDDEGSSGIDFCQGSDEVAVNDAAQALVQMQLDAGKVVEGIVLDVVAFGDTADEEFKPRKATAALASLPEDYKDYFSSKYDVSDSALDAALSAIGKAGTRKIRDYLCKSLASAKTMANKALLS